MAKKMLHVYLDDETRTLLEKEAANLELTISDVARIKLKQPFNAQVMMRPQFKA